MFLEHDANSDIAEAGNHEPAHDSSDGLPSLPPIAGAPQLPQPPSPENPPPNNTDKWWKDRKFVLEILGFTVLTAYTAFAYLQWRQIRYTNDLTARALDGSDKTLTETLKKMQAQTDATNGLYGEAQKQSGSAATMALNSIAQAEYSQRNADATKSVADIAQRTLRVSERAYISTAAPTLDLATELVVLGISNSGHIPSGKFTAVIHEATAEVPNPTAVQGNLSASEFHWQSASVDFVPVGLTYSINVPVDGVTAAKINAGKQQIYIVGNITYNDGFPEEKDQVSPFCWNSRFVSKTAQLIWGPCDYSIYIAALTKIDKYPDKAHQQ